MLATFWRFPVPFVCTYLFVPFMVSFVGAHVVMLRRELLRQDSTLRGPMGAFLMPLVVQGLQLVVYPAFSAAFATTDATAQVALVLLFPLLKYGFRALMRRLVRHMPDDGNESAVSGIEIATVMYQTILMQSAASPVATALLLTMDLLQGLGTILVFMARKPPVAQDIVHHASCLVRGVVVAEPVLSQPHGSCATPASPTKIELFRHGSTTTTAFPVRRRSDKELPPVVAHALALLHSAESLVLIEYFEVVLPAVNAVFLCVASQLDSAEYSPKLRLYRHRPAERDRALVSLLLYTSLQVLSLVVMQAVIWRRYRVSTITLLAYLLERHVWALQGKLIAWLGIMFQLLVLHYGVDFTFRFDGRLLPLN